MTPKEKQNLKALGKDLFEQTGTVDPCLGYSPPRSSIKRRSIRRLTTKQSKKRVAKLRAKGYEVKLVPSPQGMLVLKRRRRNAKHRKER